MVPPLQARVGPSPLCRPEAQRRGAAQGRALSAGEGADAGDAAVTWNEKNRVNNGFTMRKWRF